MKKSNFQFSFIDQLKPNLRYLAIFSLPDEKLKIYSYEEEENKTYSLNNPLDISNTIEGPAAWEIFKKHCTFEDILNRFWREISIDPYCEGPEIYLPKLSQEFQAKVVARRRLSDKKFLRLIAANPDWLDFEKPRKRFQTIIRRLSSSDEKIKQETKDLVKKYFVPPSSGRHESIPHLKPIYKLSIKLSKYLSKKIKEEIKKYLDKTECPGYEEETCSGIFKGRIKEIEDECNLCLDNFHSELRKTDKRFADFAKSELFHLINKPSEYSISLLTASLKISRPKLFRRISKSSRLSLTRCKY